MRHFLPFIAAAAMAVNAVDFGTTFFETNTIKYQLGLEEHHFSQNTLLSMIFTQTIYPVWIELNEWIPFIKFRPIICFVLRLLDAGWMFWFGEFWDWIHLRLTTLRYSEMGLFKLGMPMETKINENEEKSIEERNFAGICVSSQNLTQIVIP